MKRHFLTSAALVLTALLAPEVVLAQSERTSEEQDSDYPNAISSVDALTIGKSESHSIARAAEYCVQNEEFDKAIRLSRKAIDKNDDDNEIHQVYAEALEGKLKTQVERDPALYNECVKEWLIVLRQEAGLEKLAHKGIGIPGMGYLYKDEDSVIPARKHLMKLTGQCPKVWETDAKYLKKVLKPTEVDVRGKVVPPESKPNSP